MNIQYSDDSMLSEEDRALVRRVRAATLARIKRNPQERGLAPEKQDFAIGINPDGTPNYVEAPPASS